MLVYLQNHVVLPHEVELIIGMCKFISFLIDYTKPYLTFHQELNQYVATTVQRDN